MACRAAKVRPKLECFHIRYKLIERLAPTLVKSHFLMLLPACFVFVDYEGRVLGPFLMPFKEQECRIGKSVARCGVLSGRGSRTVAGQEGVGPDQLLVRDNFKIAAYV